MTFYLWSAETTTPVGRYFKPSLVSDGAGGLYMAYATTTSTSASAPYRVTLFHKEFDFFGNLVQGATTVASYDVPATDPSTGATFAFRYKDLPISASEHAVFWTTGGAYTNAATDSTTGHEQIYDASGAKVGAPFTWVFGGTIAVHNVYDITVSAAADFGNSFMVAYSTYDPSSHATQIGFETISDAGTPLTAGVFASINDGSHHGITFGTYFTAQSGSAPAYLLMYRLPQGVTSAVHIQTVAVDGTTGPDNFAHDLTIHGPNGENTNGIDDFNFSRPSDLDPKGDYGVLTETFHYHDSTGLRHEEIALQTLGPTGTVINTTEFEVASGSSTSVHLTHIGFGNIVVGYDDGLRSLIKIFDASLHQVGATLSLPHSTGDLTDLVSLGDGRFEAVWREDLTATTNVLHSAIYDTRSAGVTINDSATSTGQSIAGTLFNDTLTGGTAADRIYAAGGADRINGGAGNDYLNGGNGNDVLSGGLGIDTLAGGLGNDIYITNGGDKIVEALNAGIDLVRSSASYSLAANLENLTLLGSAAINGNGNALDNHIIGNAGNNVLNGGLGSDTLTGGAGADAFVFTAALGAGNLDTITDFDGTVDRIRVGHQAFAGLSAGNLPQQAFESNTTGLAAHATDRIVYDTATGQLFFDADGSGTGASVQFAVLDGHPALTYADFLVI